MYSLFIAFIAFISATTSYGVKFGLIWSILCVLTYKIMRGID